MWPPCARFQGSAAKLARPVVVRRRGPRRPDSYDRMMAPRVGEPGEVLAEAAADDRPLASACLGEPGPRPELVLLLRASSAERRQIDIVHGAVEGRCHSASRDSRQCGVACQSSWIQSPSRAGSARCPEKYVAEALPSLQRDRRQRRQIPGRRVVPDREQSSMLPGTGPRWRRSGRRHSAAHGCAGYLKEFAADLQLVPAPVVD